MEEQTFLSAIPDEVKVEILEGGDIRISPPNSGFDNDYVEKVIKPYLLTSVYQGERQSLPMIDLKLTKENALPYDLWGMLYDSWTPSEEEKKDKGLTVFLQGYEKRGDNNLRKRIYFSAVTPDLYASKYKEKVEKFFDELFHKNNAGKPLMEIYLKNYFDLYWDLHLGVKGDEIPELVRDIGMSFNTVLAYRKPTLRIVHDNYMKVRNNREALRQWIKEKIEALQNKPEAEQQQTFVYYWLRNSDSENFGEKDIVFECFHNFVALSQWGNTIYNIMSLLCEPTEDPTVGNPTVREWFKNTMKNPDDQPNKSRFTPLQKFVMELFRTISPNGGSISTFEKEERKSAYPRHDYVITPHKPTSTYQIHWTNAEEFDPTRYDAENVLKSNQVDETKMKEIGFAQCPFHKTSLNVKDDRENRVELTNSAFGTVYSVVDGTAEPVCDYAGFAPFGFGYRRCPGEQLTISVFEDFLRKVWKENIQFKKLSLSKPKELPIGPTTVIKDDIGFTKFTTVSLLFDGRSDYVESPHHEALNLTNNFTIEAWVKPSKLEDFQPIFNGGGYGFTLYGKRIRFTTWDHKDYDTREVPKLGDGQWHHLAVILDSNNDASFYVDGEFLQKIVGNQPAKITGNNPNRIGGGIRAFFQGQITEVRVWNCARSATEIKSNCEKRLTGYENNLVAYYPMNEGEGNTVHDQSRNKNNGLFVGQPRWIKE